MSRSEFKASFMLDKSLLDDFCKFLQEKGDKKEVTSKYQLIRVSVDKGEILVYQSGIVIFEDELKVREVIDIFLEQHNIDNPDFEKYQSVVDDFDDDEESGWNETPKGVWLNKEQVEALITQLNETLEPKEGGKHERLRYTKGKQTLVINNNGVVYTIGGFDNIIQILREIITTHNPYAEYDRIVILDEQGRWERVGPVCLTLVDFMMHEAIELQLLGVKDDTISRSINHLEFMEAVEERTSYQTLIHTPAELNSTIDTRSDYRNHLEERYHEFLSGQLLNFNEDTLLIIDAQLENLLEHSQKIVLERDQRNTPAVGISSTITNATIQKWKEDWYMQLGFDVERHNLDKLTSHSKSSELVKQFLF